MSIHVGPAGYAYHLTVLADPGNADNRRLLAQYLAGRCKPEHLERLQLLCLPMGFWHLQRKMLQDPLPWLKVLDSIEWKLFWHPLVEVKIGPADLVAAPGTAVSRPGGGGPLGAKVYPVKPLWVANMTDLVECHHPGCRTRSVAVKEAAQTMLKTLISSPGTGWRWVCQDCLKHYSSRRDVPQKAGVPLER